jgi:O-antigen/teichoic acid export membrane protein
VSATQALNPITFGLGRAATATVAVDIGLAFTNIFATRFLVHRLGPEPYGILGVVTVLSGQLLLLQFGIGPALTRRLSEARGRGDVEEAARTRRAGFSLGLASAALLALTFVTFAPAAWERGFKATPAVMEQALQSISLAAAVVAAQPMITALYGTLLGDERFFVATTCRFVHGIARLTFPVLFVVFGGGVRGVLLGQLIIDWTLVVVWRTTFRRGAVYDRAKRVATARGLLGLGVPFALAAFVAAALYDGEKIGVSVFRSLEEFTYYAVPFNAAVRFTLFGVALSTFLVPRLTAVLVAERNDEGARLAAQATRTAAAATSFVLAPVMAVVPELLGLWLGPAFAAQSTVSTRLILLGVVVLACYSGAASVVRARQKPMTLLWLYLAELPFFAVFVVALVPRFGIAGAGAAWLLRVVLDAGAQVVLARRTLGVSASPPIVVAAPVLLGAFLLGIHSMPGAFPLAARGAAGLAVGLGLALVLLTREDRAAVRRALWPAWKKARR